MDALTGKRRRKPKGKGRPQRLLPIEVGLAILAYRDGMTTKAISEAFGRKQQTFSHLFNKRKLERGERRFKAKVKVKPLHRDRHPNFTPEEIKRIMKLKGQNWSSGDIAREYAVERDTITKIIKRYRKAMEAVIG